MSHVLMLILGLVLGVMLSFTEGDHDTPHCDAEVTHVAV